MGTPLSKSSARYGVDQNQNKLVIPASNRRAGAGSGTRVQEKPARVLPARIPGSTRQPVLLRTQAHLGIASKEGIMRSVSMSAV